MAPTDFIKHLMTINNMAQENTSLSDWNKKGWVEVDGKLVKADTQVAKSVEKLPGLISGLNTVSEPVQDFLKKKEGIPMFNTAPKGNAKIKNATKSIVEGVKFDSNLEKTMYFMLKNAGINFEFQKTFILQEKFRYRDENIRAIVKIVDFYLPTRNTIIETKGYSSDVSPIKHKMLKKALKMDYGLEPEIIMPKNKKECELALNKLLYL